MKKVSKKFFLRSVIGGLGLAIVFLGLATILAMNRVEDFAVICLGLSCIAVIYGGIVMIILFCKMWAAIQDGNARTTPLKAILFMFIPLFNLYWAFQAIWGYAKDFNKYIERHGIQTQQLPEGLFLTYVILCFTTWIPFLGILLMVANIFIGLVMVSKICDGINVIASGPPQE